MKPGAGNPATDWRDLSPDEREREYSPSSCIGGNYMPFIEAYQSLSRAAIDQCKDLGGVWSEHYYGPLTANRLDFCLPPVNQNSPGKKPPLLVFIHGGYWQELSAKDSLFPAPGCIRHGAAYAALDYPLAPRANLPDIVAHCRHALAWLFANAGALGFDANRVVVAGSSAGAHLAAMVARPGRRPNDPEHSLMVRAAVMVSGIYELEPLVGTTINAALAMDAQTACAQSPVLLPLDGFPQAIVSWGDIETLEFKRQSRSFAQALVNAGTPCETLEVPHCNHFDVILDLTSDATPLGRKTLALLCND